MQALLAFRRLAYPSTGEVTGFPKRIVQSGDHHASTGGGMGEFAVAQKDTDMAEFRLGLEKDQVAGQKLVWLHLRAGSQ